MFNYIARMDGCGYGPPAESGFKPFLFVLLIVVVFYFFKVDKVWQKILLVLGGLVGAFLILSIFNDAVCRF